jgi:AcrR family transcriptional regulator
LQIRWSEYSVTVANEVAEVEQALAMGTRERQRAATRTAIIEAAAAAFVESGYAATTIASIAARAEVSPESIYLIFSNKRELLREVVEAVASGDRSAVVEGSWLTGVRAEPDQRKRLTLMGSATRDVLRRVAPFDEVVRAAGVSDPEIAELCRRHEDQRRRDIEMLIDLLAEAGPLRLPKRESADLMWALSRSTDLYRALIVDLGWDHDKAFDALDDVLTRVLLPD